MVVVDGDRVVSTATLLRESVSISGVDVPTGQVEMVATAPCPRGPRAGARPDGRGAPAICRPRRPAPGDDRDPVLLPTVRLLVRDADTAALGRRRRSRRRSRRSPFACREAWTTSTRWLRCRRPPAVADVRMPHSAGCWRWLVQRSGSTQLVAEHDGAIVATARRTPPGEGLVLGEVAGSATASARWSRPALARARSRCWSEPRPASAQLLHEIAEAPEAPERRPGVVLRTHPGLAPLLEHLRPVLLERFRSAGLGGHHEVLLSSWRSHVRFSIDEDSMSECRRRRARAGPDVEGGSGVPPDASRSPAARTRSERQGSRPATATCCSAASAT